MRTLTITTFLTLDGVLQSPGAPEEDPSGGFEQGGWLVPFFDEDMGRIVDEWFTDADAFLFGRRTYELMASYWPDAPDDDAVSAKLNNLPKYVVSTTLTPGELTWKHSTVIDDDVAGAVERLKADGAGELQVHGSGMLATALLRQGLVDELRLFTFPVVVGAGKRLFPDDAAVSLRLLDATTTASGVVAARYRPAGRPEHGTVPGA
jgi:dihydrofolate reductase